MLQIFKASETKNKIMDRREEIKKKLTEKRKNIWADLVHLDKVYNR